MSVTGQVGGGEGHRCYQPVTLPSWKQILTSPSMLGPATLFGTCLPVHLPCQTGTQLLLDRRTSAHGQAGAGSAASSCHQTLHSKAQHLPALPRWGGNAAAGHNSFSGSWLALWQGEGLDAYGFAWQHGRRAYFQMGWDRDGAH